MNSAFSRFLLFLFAFSAIIAFCIIAWNNFAPDQLRSPFMLYELLYFAVSTALTHYLLTAAHKKGNSHFIRAYMASTAVRLFVNLLIILIFGIFNRAYAVPFILGFLVLYFAFAVFEFLLIRKQLRP